MFSFFLQNPPQDIQRSDLAGVWVANYGKHQVDRLILKENGTYNQIFEDSEIGYTYETDWNPYWLEEFLDGRVFIHFDEGRYYSAGIRIAELDGMGDPCPTNFPECISGNNPRHFYDPYSQDSIEMVNELVLTIRIDPRGTVIFHHMWTSNDRGFAIIGGKTEIFRLSP